jgi:hypothetical protein
MIELAQITGTFAQQVAKNITFFKVAPYLRIQDLLSLIQGKLSGRQNVLAAG